MRNKGWELVDDMECEAALRGDEVAPEELEELRHEGRLAELARTSALLEMMLEDGRPLL